MRQIPKNSHSLSTAAACLSAATLLLASHSLSAADTYWYGAHDKYWDDNPGGNWSTGSVPTSSDDVFYSSASIYAIDLGSHNANVNSITIDSATAYSFNDEAGSETLTTGAISVLTGTSHAFNVPLVLTQDITFDVSASAGVAVSGVISGSSGLTKSGAGDLTLTGTNTYTGDTNINAGTILLGDTNRALQNSTVYVNVDGGLDLQNLDGVITGTGCCSQLPPLSFNSHEYTALTRFGL